MLFLDFFRFMGKSKKDTAISNLFSLKLKEIITLVETTAQSSLKLEEEILFM